MSVTWLTSYPDLTQNASRVKTARLANGQVLVLWEAWTGTRYLGTQALTLNARGGVVLPATALGRALRLTRRDDLLVEGNVVWTVSGSAGDGRLEISRLVLR
jgi:hypothetical protein